MNKALRSNTSLIALDLSGRFEVQYIAQKMLGVDLSNNKDNEIDDEGVKVLSEALHHNHSLKVLDLSRNNRNHKTSIQSDSQA